MQRIIKIAIREYVETIKTKAFIFGVLLAPLVIGVIVFFADRISRGPGGAETDDYLAWKAEEPDGETTYHLELNNITLHFFNEEWQEFLKLAGMLVTK